MAKLPYREITGDPHKDEKGKKSFTGDDSLSNRSFSVAETQRRAWDTSTHSETAHNTDQIRPDDTYSSEDSYIASAQRLLHSLGIAKSTHPEDRQDFQERVIKLTKQSEKIMKDEAEQKRTTTTRFTQLRRTRTLIDSYRTLSSDIDELFLTFGEITPRLKNEKINRLFGKVPLYRSKQTFAEHIGNELFDDPSRLSHQAIEDKIDALKLHLKKDFVPQAKDTVNSNEKEDIYNQLLAIKEEVQQESQKNKEHISISTLHVALNESISLTDDYMQLKEEIRWLTRYFPKRERGTPLYQEMLALKKWTQSSKDGRMIESLAKDTENIINGLLPGLVHTLQEKVDTIIKGIESEHRQLQEIHRQMEKSNQLPDDLPTMPAYPELLKQCTQIPAEIAFVTDGRWKQENWTAEDVASVQSQFRELQHIRETQKIDTLRNELEQDAIRIAHSLQRLGEKLKSDLAASTAHIETELEKSTSDVSLSTLHEHTTRFEPLVSQYRKFDRSVRWLQSLLPASEESTDQAITEAHHRLQELNSEIDLKLEDTSKRVTEKISHKINLIQETIRDIHDDMADLRINQALLLPMFTTYQNLRHRYQSLHEDLGLIMREDWSNSTNNAALKKIAGHISQIAEDHLSIKNAIETAGPLLAEKAREKAHHVLEQGTKVDLATITISTLEHVIIDTSETMRAVATDRANVQRTFQTMQTDPEFSDYVQKHAQLVPTLASIHERLGTQRETLMHTYVSIQHRSGNMLLDQLVTLTTDIGDEVKKGTAHFSVALVHAGVARSDALVSQKQELDRSLTLLGKLFSAPQAGFTQALVKEWETLHSLNAQIQKKMKHMRAIVDTQMPRKIRQMHEEADHIQERMGHLHTDIITRHKLEADLPGSLATYQELRHHYQLLHNDFTLITQEPWGEQDWSDPKKNTALSEMNEYLTLTNNDHIAVKHAIEAAVPLLVESARKKAHHILEQGTKTDLATLTISDLEHVIIDTNKTMHAVATDRANVQRTFQTMQADPEFSDYTKKHAQLVPALTSIHETLGTQRETLMHTYVSIQRRSGTMFLDQLVTLTTDIRDEVKKGTAHFSVALVHAGVARCDELASQQQELNRSLTLLGELFSAPQAGFTQALVEEWKTLHDLNAQTQEKIKSTLAIVDTHMPEKILQMREEADSIQQQMGNWHTDILASHRLQPDLSISLATYQELHHRYQQLHSDFTLITQKHQGRRDWSDRKKNTALSEIDGYLSLTEQDNLAVRNALESHMQRLLNKTKQQSNDYWTKTQEIDIDSDNVAIATLEEFIEKATYTKGTLDETIRCFSIMQKSTHSYEMIENDQKQAQIFQSMYDELAEHHDKLKRRYAERQRFLGERLKSQIETLVTQTETEMKKDASDRSIATVYAHVTLSRSLTGQHEKFNRGVEWFIDQYPAEERASQIRPALSGDLANLSNDMKEKLAIVHTNIRDNQNKSIDNMHTITEHINSQMDDLHKNINDGQIVLHNLREFLETYQKLHHQQNTLQQGLTLLKQGNWGPYAWNQLNTTRLNSIEDGTKTLEKKREHLIHATHKIIDDTIKEGDIKYKKFQENFIRLQTYRTFTIRLYKDSEDIIKDAHTMIDDIDKINAVYAKMRTIPNFSQRISRDNPFHLLKNVRDNLHNYSIHIRQIQQNWYNDLVLNPMRAIPTLEQCEQVLEDIKDFDSQEAGKRLGLIFAQAEQFQPVMQRLELLQTRNMHQPLSRSDQEMIADARKKTDDYSSFYKMYMIYDTRTTMAMAYLKAYIDMQMSQYNKSPFLEEQKLLKEHIEYFYKNNSDDLRNAIIDEMGNIQKMETDKIEDEEKKNQKEKHYANQRDQWFTHLNQDLTSVLTIVSTQVEALKEQLAAYDRQQVIGAMKEDQ